MAYVTVVSGEHVFTDLNLFNLSLGGGDGKLFPAAGSFKKMIITGVRLLFKS